MLIPRAFKRTFGDDSWFVEGRVSETEKTLEFLCRDDLRDALGETSATPHFRFTPTFDGPGPCTWRSRRVAGVESEEVFVPGCVFAHFGCEEAVRGSERVLREPLN